MFCKKINIPPLLKIKFLIPFTHFFFYTSLFLFIFTAKAYSQPSTTPSLIPPTSEAPIPQISLFEAIGKVLCNNPSIQSNKLDITIQQGLANENSTPFDPLFEASYEHKIRDNTKLFGIVRGRGRSAHTNTLNFAIGKTLRIGTKFLWKTFLEQIDDPAFVILEGGYASLSFRITQPLQRGFLNSIDSTEERSSRIEIVAVRYETLHSISESIQETTSRYWDLVATKQALNIRRDSEERIKKLIENTKILIDEQHLAANDINQPQAQLATLRIKRIQAEQNLFLAMAKLIASMGYASNPFTFNDADLKTDNLPMIDTLLTMKSYHSNTLASCALQKRFDLLAAEKYFHSAEQRLKGALNEKKIEFNVFAEAAIVDDHWRRPRGSVWEAAKMKEPMRDYILGASISVPLYNTGAKGLEQQRRAERRQELEKIQELKIQAVSEVDDTWSNQRALALEVAKANEAVAEYKVLLENEVKKFKEGESTLFVLIDFEQQLTNALEQQVELKKQYAKNLARLHFVTGTLLTADRDLCNFEISDITKLPALE